MRGGPQTPVNVANEQYENIVQTLNAMHNAVLRMDSRGNIRPILYIFVAHPRRLEYENAGFFVGQESPLFNEAYQQDKLWMNDSPTLRLARSAKSHRRTHPSQHTGKEFIQMIPTKVVRVLDEIAKNESTIAPRKQFHSISKTLVYAAEAVAAAGYYTFFLVMRPETKDRLDADPKVVVSPNLEEALILERYPVENFRKDILLAIRNY